MHNVVLLHVELCRSRDCAKLRLLIRLNLPAPFEDILIPLLLQHCLILLVITLTKVVLVVALLLRPLSKYHVMMMMMMLMMMILSATAQTNQ